jgi:transcription antitermination factor NusG
MNWYALYVKSRNEKKVAKRLTDLGIEVYCPIKKEVRQWSDRKKIIEVPIIPSYLFVRINERDRELVFQAQGVVRYIFWLGKPAIIRNEEIEVLKTYAERNGFEVNLDSIKPGDVIAVPDGPFKGSEGIVKELDKNRIQLLLIGLGFKITFSKL